MSQRQRAENRLYAALQLCGRPPQALWTATSEISNPDSVPENPAATSVHHCPASENYGNMQQA